MNEENLKSELVSLFKQVSVLYDKPVTNELTKIYIEAFKEEELNINDLILALKTHLKKGRFFPKPIDLIEVIKPKLVNQNEGIEFAIRMIDLLRRHGTDRMEEYVIQEFSQVGYSVYKQVKEDLRLLTVDATPNYQAKLRDIYNSYKEREKYNQLDKLPYSNQNYIDTVIKNSVKEIGE